jgi:hypothetical protein
VEVEEAIRLGGGGGYKRKRIIWCRTGGAVANATSLLCSLSTIVSGHGPLTVWPFGLYEQRGPRTSGGRDLYKQNFPLTERKHRAITIYSRYYFICRQTQNSVADNLTPLSLTTPYQKGILYTI